MNQNMYLQCANCLVTTVPVFSNISATAVTKLNIRNWLNFVNNCPNCGATNWQLCIEPARPVMEQARVIEGEMS